jgi:hypothetical protein
MRVVVHPSARETFTTRELVAAYKEFTEHGRNFRTPKPASVPQRPVWRARADSLRGG